MNDDAQHEPADNPSVNAAMVQAATIALAHAETVIQEQRAEIDRLRAEVAALRGEAVPHDDTAA